MFLVWGGEEITVFAVDRGGEKWRSFQTGFFGTSNGLGVGVSFRCWEAWDHG